MSDDPDLSKTEDMIARVRRARTGPFQSRKIEQFQKTLAARSLSMGGLCRDGDRLFQAEAISAGRGVAGEGHQVCAGLPADTLSWVDTGQVGQVDESRRDLKWRALRWRTKRQQATATRLRLLDPDGIHDFLGMEVGDDESLVKASRTIDRCASGAWRRAGRCTPDDR